MRVLHVTQPVSAGVPAVVLQYLASQRRAGLEVVLASPPGQVRDKAAAQGITVEHWAATRSPDHHVPREAKALEALIRRVKPDVVHLHSAKAGLAGRLAVRGAIPTIFQPHAWSFDAVGGVVRSASLAWERFGVRWADVIVCVSEAERRRGLAIGVRGNYRVLPNQASEADYPAPQPDDRATARARLGLDPLAPLAVCVGRLAEQKGQDILLAAWPAVRGRLDGARLALVGDGPLRPTLAAALPPGVDLVGESDHVRWWYLAADVVVVPSRWEGMALVPLEARACARSVVASDATGLAETVTPGTGAVVGIGDRHALAEALRPRLADRELADREGALGRDETERGWRTGHEADICSLVRELAGA